MKNSLLTKCMLFSMVIISSGANAGLANSRIDHKGVLSVAGKDSIRLEQRAGNSILLNKGQMELRTEKVPMGFSLLDPRLILKQNGQTLAIDIPTDYYHNDEAFTYLAKNSGLNYDLYLRKLEASGKSLQKVETVECFYKTPQLVCGLDNSGNPICVGAIMDKVGKQQVKNTYQDKTVIYKLTLGKNSVQQAEFTSSVTTAQKVKTEALEDCRK